MAEARPRPNTIDEYIAGFPEDVGEKLEKLRQTILKAAPEASEGIKYGIPAFLLHGSLVHFGVFGDRIDFYPVPSPAEAFGRELADYRQGRGSARFPIDRPLPLKLIAQIVSFRAAQNLERAFSRNRLGR